MRCDECGYYHWSTEWDWYWEAYLCDYCWDELEYLDYLEYKKYLTYSYGYYY